MEVQAHGNLFEDIVIKSLTGLSKEEYQKLIPRSYTSSLDLHKDIKVDFNGSIKTTGGDGIACSDLLKFFTNTCNNDLRLTVGCWNQINTTTKIFHSVYEFYIKPEYSKLLWANINEETLSTFVNYVKSIPHGKEAQLKNQEIWPQKRDAIFEQYGKGLVSIDAKVDSKIQRRVQCGLSLKKLIKSTIPYTKYDYEYKEIKLPIEINSSPRQFKKKISYKITNNANQYFELFAGHSR